jgi:hypothetical protein
MQNWKQLRAEALRAFHCKTKILRDRFKKAFINGAKWKEWKCGENHLKVQWIDVRWNGSVANLNGFKPNEREVKNEM